MFRHRFSVALSLALLLSIAAGSAQDEEAFSDRTFFAVSPIAGWNRDTLKMHGPGGTMVTETETAPEYGFFAIYRHPNLVINNFLFYTEVNDADVLGDLFFANYYADSKAAVTWNVGVGYLYHKIEPENVDIEVNVPMVKAGPLFRIADLHLCLNPYIGYAWERIDTTHGDQNNDSYLYGLSGHWQWRMVQLAVKYYFQDSQEIDEDFHTDRARLNVGLTENWGFVVRVDYMEHQTTEDTSILVGPTCVF